MLILALIGGAAGAGICEDLQLRPAPAVVPGQACQPLAEGLALCYSCGPQPIDQAQLDAWGVDLAALTEAASQVALSGLTEGRPVRQEIADMPGQFYWLSGEGDGLDSAGLLHPARLSAIAGTTPIVGVPAQGALLFWIPGDPAVDKVIAVGIRRMFEAAAQPVSDKLYRWHNNAWVVWGEVQLQQ